MTTVTLCVIPAGFKRYHTQAGALDKQLMQWWGRPCRRAVVIELCCGLDRCLPCLCCDNCLKLCDSIRKCQFPIGYYIPKLAAACQAGGGGNAWQHTQQQGCWLCHVVHRWMFRPDFALWDFLHLWVDNFCFVWTHTISLVSCNVSLREAVSFHPQEKSHHASDSSWGREDRSASCFCSERHME